MKVIHFLFINYKFAFEMIQFYFTECLEDLNKIFKMLEQKYVLKSDMFLKILSRGINVKCRYYNSLKCRVELGNFNSFVKWVSLSFHELTWMSYL